MAGIARHAEVVAMANLLLLTDGRFPAGGYAHSGGIEQAAERGRIRDETDLHAFLHGSLMTIGANAATFAAAACATWSAGSSAGHRDEVLALLVSEESARMPSAALRVASRAQARQLLRAASASWADIEFPRASVVTGDVHLATAQGLVGAALEMTPGDSALLCAYAAVTGPAAAAVRLLGLDPFAVNRVTVALWPVVAEIVEEAADLAYCSPADLPCRTAPLLEIGGEQHLAREPRMFAS
ncbi:MAG: urease accessory UreF family protein [Solirubrobacterales bacterium]